MSVWTHVSGVIRLDYIRDKDDIFKILGITSNFYDYQEACKLPSGSEGSIYYTTVKDSHPMQVDSESQSIVITGDLRDYDDIEELESWFRKVVKDLDSAMMVRSCFLFATTENDKFLNLSRDFNNKWSSFYTQN